MKKLYLLFLLFAVGLGSSFAQNDQVIQAALDSIQKSSNYPGIVFSTINSEGGSTLIGKWLGG